MNATLVEPAAGQNMKYKVAADLAEKLIPVDTLVQHPKNPRNGDVETIAESLDEHGQFKPIVVNLGNYSQSYQRNTIGAGNHTYQASIQNGWTHIAVTWVDVDDVELDKILLIDNRTSDLGWDDKARTYEILRGMPTLAGTGYDQLAFEELADEQNQPLEYTGERKKTPEERLAVYESTSLRQIHLIMNETEYDWLMPRLGQLSEEYNKETNAEIVTQLVAEHFGEEAPDVSK